ncbi:MAG: NADP-dependent oxidoreductase [Halioglobus sp.]
MALRNNNIQLAARPDGLPDHGCWHLSNDTVPQPRDRELLVEVKHISLDPAMRAWMNESCYIGGVDIGETMRAFGVGEILKSNHPEHEPGDLVRGMLGVQEYSVISGDDEQLNRLDVGDEPLSTHLGIYGMTGLTAYAGMTKEVSVSPGQQVLISSASGAVGSIAAQIAKLQGARVVGIAGGPKKAAMCIDQMGLDACIDYKSGDVSEQIRQTMPDGVDIYFDNVGIPILDQVLDHINQDSTTLICGAINQFQHLDQIIGPALYLRLAERRSVMRGFTYYHYLDSFDEAVSQLKQWVGEGKVKYFEHQEHGLEDFHAVFNKLFEGGNYGKLILTP